MPSLDCPVCAGSGYVHEDAGETTICARCDGTGVVFVEEIAGRVAPTPSNFERIIELNRAGISSEGDPTDLEAGANRCAAG